MVSAVFATLDGFLPQFQGLLGLRVYQGEKLVFELNNTQSGVEVSQQQAAYTFDYVFSEPPHLDALTHLSALLYALFDLEQRHQQVKGLAQQKEQETYAALHNLRQTQAQLVDAEKMGALGSLVAGMAHELNTPLGIGVTALSALQEDLKQLHQHFEKGTLSRHLMQQGLSQMQEAAGLLHTHLQEAVTLIDDFKRVAPRHVHDHAQAIALRDHIQAIVNTHRADTNHVPFAFAFDAPEAFEVKTYPRVWAQIIHELLNNSQYHAFPGNPHPQVRCELHVFTPEPQNGISALLHLMDHRLDAQEGQGLALADIPQTPQGRFVYADNGPGVAETLKSVLFEPFSTRSPAEYSGLGLYMVYNLVHQKLGGDIHMLQSEHGLQLEIRFPLCISEPET